jgi:hypothetical protein
LLVHYIKVPAPFFARSIDDQPIVTLNELKVEEPLLLTFSWFVRGRLTDMIFSQSAQNVFAGAEILQALRKLPPELPGESNEPLAILAVESSHYEILKKAVDTPNQQTPYNPQLAHNFPPFIRAVLNATTEKPSEGEN